MASWALPEIEPETLIWADDPPVGMNDAVGGRRTRMALTTGACQAWPARPPY